MEKEIKEFDLEVKKHLYKCLQNSNNDIETKIINYCLLLSDSYSFSKYQTYPRPEHPLASKRKNVYFTMVAILLSIRTTLENEQKAVENFINHFENIDQVINTNVNELAEIIKCAGMPNKKAETIIKASKYIKEKFNNDWAYFDNLSVEKSREILMDIPGIGEKAADCLLELGLNKPSIVIDVNMLRIISRLFNFEWVEKLDLSNKLQLEYTKAFLEKYLRKDYFLFQIVHTLLLVHGKNICSSKMHCGDCFLKSYCEYSKLIIKDFLL